MKFLPPAPAPASDINGAPISATKRGRYRLVVAALNIMVGSEDAARAAHAAAREYERDHKTAVIVWDGLMEREVSPEMAAGKR